MKRLIVCCDGTWNTADQEHNGKPCPTNVVRLAYRIATRDGEIPQVVFYEQGVGTGNLVDRWTGGAFGDGLEENIHNAYRFLIANYDHGDEIFVFGFSRGAFTARSLVGMIRKCGILSRLHMDAYKSALDLYHSEDRPDDAKPTKFRCDCTIAGEQSVPIRFIGVWDTVGALGIPLRGLRAFTRRDYQFHDTELSGCVRTACHALAIDEHRAPFEPTLWTYKPKPDQTVEQVWFCGVHSDIGGGYPETDLSNVALAWMLDRAADAGLVFDPEVQSARPVIGNSRGTLHNSMTSFYRVTPGMDRHIGVGDDPTQSLHTSVMERWDSDATYRPKGLQAYFKRIGDPRASG